MKKLKYIFVVIVLLSTLMSGCSSPEVPNEPPEISITIGDNDIEYIVGKNKWGNEIYDREDTFPETATNLTIDKLVELSSKGEELSWQDFDSYNGIEVGSGLYIKEYNITGANYFVLLIGGSSLDGKPMYIYLINNKTDKKIDIRFDDVEEFIKLE